LCFDGAVDGAHDLGGRQGFGPVEVEPDEPVFHEPWEQQVFGITAAMSVHGLGTMGESRHSYESWLAALERPLADHDVVPLRELDA